jgi:hypothetical protein
MVGGKNHSLMVKVPRGESPRRSAVTWSRHAGDRPRLTPAFDPACKYEYEHVALHAIDRHFRSLRDPRFGTIRVLDVLEGEGAIIMERSHDPALRNLLLRSGRLPAILPPELLATGLRNAGGWLREYHGLTGLAPVNPQNTNVGDFVNSIHRYTNFLLTVHGIRRPLLRELARCIESVAHATLDETLPIGISHGDFAPRNILVGPRGRITVIDTLGKWKSPIYQDLASFLVELSASPPQIYSGGLLFSPRQIASFEDEFLRGYFDMEPVPRAAIRLFQIQDLLDKWAEQVFLREKSSGMRRVRASCRLAVRSSYFAGQIDRILARLQYEVNGERRHACHV